MSSSQSSRQLARWAIGAALLAVSLTWLGFAVFALDQPTPDEPTLPVAYWTVVCSALVALALLLRRSPSPPRPKPQPSGMLVETVIQQLRAALREPTPDAVWRRDDLVDDLAFLANADRGYARVPTRLRSVLQESAERMSRRGLRLQLHEGGDPHVATDASALSHALECLLRDAGTQGVRVQLTAEGPSVELAVVGVKPPEPSLAVAQRIVEALAGSVEIESETCRIRLPLLT